MCQPELGWGFAYYGVLTCALCPTHRADCPIFPEAVPSFPIAVPSVAMKSSVPGIEISR
jgi:hypothetical protein